MKWALVLLIAVTLSFSGFTDHEADSNRLGHRKHRMSSTIWRKYARDRDAPLDSTAMCYGKTDGTWVSRGRVRTNADNMKGRWSMITGGPAVYDDHNLHEYMGNTIAIRQSDGNIGHDTNPINLVENCFSLLTISGKQGSGSTSLLSTANIPW